MGTNYETGRKLLEKAKSDRQFFDASGYRFYDVEQSEGELRRFLFANAHALINQNGAPGANVALTKTVDWLSDKGFVRHTAKKVEHLTGCVAFSVPDECDCPLPHIRRALEHL
jgi:hypothetical protein